jgi:hypothetical protein
MIARMEFGRAAPKSIQDRFSSSGSLAMLAAMPLPRRGLGGAPPSDVAAHPYDSVPAHRCFALSFSVEGPILFSLGGPLSPARLALTARALADPRFRFLVLQFRMPWLFGFLRFF